MSKNMQGTFLRPTALLLLNVSCKSGFDLPFRLTGHINFEVVAELDFMP